MIPNPDSLPYYERSLHKERQAVFDHYRARGVTNERKLESLWWRWRHQKGEREPNKSDGAQ